MVHDTAFGIIGERLMTDLQRQARETVEHIGAEIKSRRLPTSLTLPWGGARSRRGRDGMDVGFAAPAAWGSAMVLRLLEQGHRLTVWNRTAVKGRCCSSAERAGPSRRSMGGGDGLLSGPVAGKLFIEMSTLTPEITKRPAPRPKVRRCSNAPPAPRSAPPARASCSASPLTTAPLSPAPSRCSSSFAAASIISGPAAAARP